MQKIKKFFPQPIKNIYHLLLAIVANIFFGFPARKIKIIGVTGTDGKTTTVQMITKIIEEAGKSVAMASTINFRIKGEEEKNSSHFTTMSVWKLQKFIKEAVKKNCEYLVLEVSSHSLDQKRIWGINFETAAITNITREHLDYHKTMKKYRKIKLKLFKKAKKIVVNMDMDSPMEFININSNAEKFGYAINSKKQFLNEKIKTIVAENIELGILGTEYKMHVFNASHSDLGGQDMTYKIQLPGLFNVENALAATAVALGEGIEQKTIKEALKKISGVAGRMEAIENDLDLDIIIDYAVTPNALERLYSFLLSLKKNDSKIIAIFGSCGDRDRGKRPIMGEIISKYADFLIITNEEPYYEDPEKIINEISKGIKNKKENINFWKIIDRREAIKKALSIANKKDIIVITGMGDQDSMIVKGKKIIWNDKQVILEEIKKF